MEGSIVVIDLLSLPLMLTSLKVINCLISFQDFSFPIFLHSLQLRIDDLVQSPENIANIRFPVNLKNLRLNIAGDRYQGIKYPEGLEYLAIGNLISTSTLGKLPTSCHALELYSVNNSMTFPVDLKYLTFVECSEGFIVPPVKMLIVTSCIEPRFAPMTHEISIAFNYPGTSSIGFEMGMMPPPRSKTRERGFRKS